MAQMISEDKPEKGRKIGTSNNNSNNNVSGFKLNVDAPEFVPRSHDSSTTTGTQMGYYYPYVQFIDGSTTPVVGTDWFYVNNDQVQVQDPFHVFSTSFSSLPNCSRNVLTEDLQHKIIKQVEYLFSDLSLMANDTMAKHVSKDPEGYVPIPVVASMKKIKALVTDHLLLVQALCSSTKLVVSKDSKKVKRKIPFTETYKDELQCRTVVVENLPDDHSYPNLEKIFSTIGSVKAIRLCHPPEANASRAKNDIIISNKLHALVEYESAEVAEIAADRLNDERNWRKGMRVRVMLRCSPKSVLKGRKSDFDTLTDDECHNSSEETLQRTGVESTVDNNVEEISVAIRSKSAATTGNGRGKTKGRSQCHSGRGLLSSPPPQSVGVNQCDSSVKQVNKGPRMPDGTRGFTMGRGKPMVSPSAVSSSVE